MSDSYNFVPGTLRKRDWSWLPLGVSAVLHVLILATLLIHPFPSKPNNSTEASLIPATQAVALQKMPALQLPPPPPPPPPPPADREPEKPKKETPLGPDAKKPDEQPKEKGPERPLPDPDLIDASKKLADAAPPMPKPEEKKSDQPTPPDPSTVRFISGPTEASRGLTPQPVSPWSRSVPEPVDPMTGKNAQPESKPVSSAASSNGRYGFDPGTASNLWRPSFKEAAGECVKIPDLGVDASGKPILASVQGRVYWEDHRTPLVGAQLQIIGTPFVTFSDSHGEYNLRFDPRMLEKCQIAYVRVRANGFTGAQLTLSIGERVRSDDVVLRRK